MIRTAGAHIKSGKLYLSVVEQTDDVELVGVFVGPSVRIEPSSSLLESARLANFKDRIASELGAAKVDRIVLVDTRQHGSWTYRNAYNRVTAAAALMLASHDLGLAFSTEKTTVIAKYLKVNASELDSVECARFGIDHNPRYWTTGLAQASAGAAYAISKEVSER